MRATQLRDASTGASRSVKGEAMKIVYVKTQEKGELRAVVIKENAKTLWVQLPDGNVIKRHKSKHLVK